LGRDRFSRLVHGSRVSLLLAPAAALLSLSIATLVGLAAGQWGGWRERTILAGNDLVLSLPWLFLLLTIRALLPLNVPPWLSVGITFALLGMLGWAAAARVIHAGVRSLRNSDFALQARACGCSPRRLLLAHILPNLRPVLLAQFWILVPAFLLSEANLGLLGLGVAEPLPSLGSLLREMENLPALASSPWLLAPAALLLLVVSCIQVVFSKREDLA
jgi:ABC-type dipeptide/oligopeptide/nickel transport system permease subunit